jgi:hypothetical protein
VSLWRELRRRKVFRAGLAYLAAAWLFLQVAETVLAAFDAAAWLMQALLFVTAFGFPVAILLTWVYELSPAGSSRTADISGDKGASQPRGQVFGAMAVALTAGALLGSGAVWLLGRDTDERWARDEAIPELESIIATADWDAAFELATAIAERVPGEPLLEELWPQFSWLTTIPSDPPGATVLLRPYDSTEDDWEILGSTPLEGIRMPFGLYRLRIELEGYESIERTLGGGTRMTTELSVTDSVDTLFDIPPERYRLDPVGTVPSDSVRVAAWGVPPLDPVMRFESFLLDRYEVTNRQYKEFVDAGGYDRTEYWEHPFELDGRTLPWDEAMARLTDRTGRPGPSTWIGGTYPDGQEDYPVGGVSWYEAAAYARFVRRELPTVHHWRRAYAPSSLPWTIPASNLASDGPQPVGESGSMSWTGAYDILGNVREWAYNSHGDQRAILGGAWTDPLYSAQAQYPLTLSQTTAQPPFNRSEANGIRLALTNDEPDVAAWARLPVTTGSTTQSQPVSDEVFAVFKSFYDYDAAPLNARIEATEEFQYWTRERIVFDAAYEGEQMMLYLFLPKSGSAPFQTTLYWPGSSAISLNSIDAYPVHLDFILKSGRAVAFPVLKGTFERWDGSPYLPPSTIAGRDDRIDRVRDVRRSIDYLETRSDIDGDALSYYGQSWGGSLAPLVLAVEPRLKVGVLYVAGFGFPSLQEADPSHFLPRVEAPTLMLNGDTDMVFFPFDENVQPFFDGLGTPDENKRLVVERGGHFIPRDTLIRETLDWLDTHLGEPRS